MKRSFLLACAGLLLAACASGADVADDATPADSADFPALEGDTAQGQQAP